MAKGRLINKRIWKSETLMDLTPTQLLLWIGLITTADDQGRGRAHPGLVRSEVFPVRDIGWDEIATTMQRFAEMGMLILYTDGTTSLYQIANWWDEKYQGGMAWARPSEYPAPDGWIDRIRYRQGNSVVKQNWDADVLTEDSGIDDGELTVSPSRDHGEPALEPAPNDNDNMNDNMNDNTNTQNHGAPAPDMPDDGPDKTTKDAVRGALEDYFAQVTGIPKPDTSNDKARRSAGTRWWSPLRSLAEVCDWDVEIAKHLTDSVVGYMRTRGLTITAPKSIQSIATAAYTGNAPDVGFKRELPKKPKKRVVRVVDSETGEVVEREAIV